MISDAPLGLKKSNSVSGAFPGAGFISQSFPVIPVGPAQPEGGKQYQQVEDQVPVLNSLKKSVMISMQRARLTAHRMNI